MIARRVIGLSSSNPPDSSVWTTAASAFLLGVVEIREQGDN
jgi:hypothetical protein